MQYEAIRFLPRMMLLTSKQLAPAEYLIHAHSNEAIGVHCLEYTHPEFREKVNQGFNIVVAGKAFGCGSSRQEAVMALLGCGIKCVIAESFAFIYNQPSLGLVGIVITDPAFYKLAVDGVEVSIDLETNKLQVKGKEFGFDFSEMERKLMDLGGITQAFHKYGKELFQTMCKPNNAKVFRKPYRVPASVGEPKESSLAW
jgi:3-isopropylmalate dehydratase small subunit